jgi:uncharacterized membrane protein YheB (UPF0754 family)
MSSIVINDLDRVNILLNELSPEELTAINGGGIFGAIIGAIVGTVVGISNGAVLPF